LIDIEEIRALVQPDGSDFELVKVEGDTVHLRLLVEDATCAECVMPKPILEEMAVGILRRSSPEVTRVEIDDPREA
jgi:Fe-S cluster biogenesis protein NfuA